jgi:hypothetical protein
MIRLHTYADGRTGLAAFCDVCGEQITEHGYVVWKYHDDNDQPVDVLIVHQARCDPGGDYRMSMPLDVELVYLANSAGVDLNDAAEHVRFFAGI